MAIICSTSAFKGNLPGALSTIRRLGFNQADLICIPSWEHVIPSELADDFEAAAGRIEQLLKESGLKAAACNMALDATYQREDKQINIKRLQQTEAVARLAARLGAEVVSFYPGYRVSDRPWETALADSIRSICEMIEAGRRHGITIAVEPHYATIYETVEQTMTLLDAVPELMVAYDPSHFAMQGVDLSETEGILDRAVHMHLRDAAPDAMCVPAGKGTVDFKWLADAMKKRGYAGHWSLELLPGKVDNIEEELTDLRDMMTKLLAD